MENPYYLIRRSHLPEGMRKTVEVMELLRQHPGMSVLQATQKVDVSRSVFYRYKDVVKPFYAQEQAYIITLSLVLKHIPGVLSRVLNLLSADSANVLTINQSLPLQGVATVIVTVDTRQMDYEVETCIEKLRRTTGVESVTLVGQG